MDTATSNTGGGSAFASDSSTNLATVIKGLKKFDGKDPAEFKTWMKKFCVVLGVTRKDILPLLKKQRKPDPADTAAFDSYTRANEDLYAILFLLVELPAALSIQKHEDDTGISGDGQAAFEELCNNYDRVTDEVIRAKMEELENNPMNPGENPDDYFNQKHLLRTQLDKMGEPISDRRFKHICVQGFSDEYKDVKLMVFRDPTFNVLDMQSTMRNIFLDEQSRKGWKGRIAGRGFAMATTASDIICHGCYEPGHIRRNCPKIKNRAKKKTKPAGATKWCSKHNTTSHSDEECYQQGGKRPGDTKDSSKAFTACSNCTHCSSASNKHDSNNEVAVVDFTRDEDAFDSGFMFATCSRISGRNFAASSTGVGLLVDTGASETMFDNRLIPDGNLHDYTQRNSPKIVDVAGESQLKGTATGILHCTVKDNRGQRLRVRIQGLIVPGLGRNIFSPHLPPEKGIALRRRREHSAPHYPRQGDSTHTRSARPRHVHPRHHVRAERPAIWHEIPRAPPEAVTDPHGERRLLYASERGHLAQEAWTSQCSEPGHPSEGHGYRGGLSRQSLPLRGLPDRETQAVPPPEAIDSRTITAWTACGHRQHGAC